MGLPKRRKCVLSLIYDRVWLLQNSFHPVMRLRDKCHRPGGGPARSYGQPQTPIDRLCATATLVGKCQAALPQLRQGTNPLQLRSEIPALLLCLSRFPQGMARQAARRAPDSLPVQVGSILKWGTSPLG